MVDEFATSASAPAAAPAPSKPEDAVSHASRNFIVLRKAGLDAAGVYYAAWTLGGLNIGIVLQALGTDFYPRLVGLAKNNGECNRLVNEQVRVYLLLAVPGVIITLAMAPFAVSLFSSASSSPVGVLHWICIGMAVRALTWPLGFIVVAKKKQGLFLSIDLAWTVVNIALAWWCVDSFGVIGAGMAFFGSYVFHGLRVYPIMRRWSSFQWTVVNLKTAACGIATVAAVFIGLRTLPSAAAISFGILAAILSSYVSIQILVHLTSPQGLPRSIGRFLQLRRSSR